MMITMKDLAVLQAIDPKSVDQFDLVDIKDIVVKEHLSQEEKILDFINQIKNPYLCRCGDIVVQSVFSDTDITLTDCLKQYFQIV